MSRTVTVTFEDGTQHVYQNVPDNASPDSVTARAQQEFNKTITGIDGGRTPEKSTLQKIIGPTVEGNWEKDSLIAPVIQGIAGRVMPALGLMEGQEAQQMVQQSDANLIQKGKNFVQGVKTVAEDPMAAAKRVYQAVTERPAETAGQLVKGIAYDPELLLFGPGAMGRSAQALETAGTAVSKTAQAVKPVVVAPYTVPRDVFKGAFVNEPKSPSSAMVPLAETYYPSQAGREFMAGRMDLPELEATATPTAALRSDPMFRMAEKFANKDVTGQSLVPLPGRSAEAFGERLMAGYQRNPTTAIADIALPFIGVPPIQPFVRGAQMIADKYLANKTQFQPGFIEQLSAARSAQAGPPRPPGAPVTGPVAPQPIPAQNQMMLPLSNQIATPPGQFNLQTTPGEMPKTIQQQVQEAAASRVIGMPKQDPGVAAVARNEQAQAMLAQIRARGTNQSAPAVAAPIAPAETPFVPPANWTADAGYKPPTAGLPSEKTNLEKIRERMAKEITPEQIAANNAKVAEYNALPKAEKAAQTRAETAAAKDPDINEKPILGIDTSSEYYGAKNPQEVYKKKLIKEMETNNVSPSTIKNITDEVITMGQGREKPVGVNVAKKAMAEAEAAGKFYDITYRSKGDVIRESNRRTTFKPDPSITLTNTQRFGNGTVVANGTRNGKPVTIRVDKDGKYTIE
jgi:hypothetical protein